MTPDPTCDHLPVQRVTAGSWEGAHASTYVCGRADCLEEAIAWVSALMPGADIVAVRL